MKGKNFVTYAKKVLVLMITIAKYLKLEVIVIILENLEELLIVFAI